MSILRTNERMFPLHPGEMLREEFVVPLNLSAEKLANALHVSAALVTDMIEERRGIDAEMALRLSRYFGNTAEFWMNLQSGFELSSVSDKVASNILRDVQPALRDKESGRLITHPGEANVQPSHA